MGDATIPGQWERRNRPLAALDLILQGDAERAVFQLAYMTPDEQRACMVACRRMADALEQMLPMPESERQAPLDPEGDDGE